MNYHYDERWTIATTISPCANNMDREKEKKTMLKSTRFQHKKQAEERLKAINAKGTTRTPEAQS